MSKKNGLDKRLRALEERACGADPLKDFPDWDLVDQLEAVIEVLRWYKEFHSDGVIRYPATDRELHVLALLHSLVESGGPPPKSGEHRFPSSLTVAWREYNDGTHSVSTSWRTRLEDLPDDTRRYFERMNPPEQPERERFLYADRHRAKKRREHTRWHDEYGWDRSSPKHLRYWVAGGED